MVICFFGDSLVNGVNDPEGIGWVGRLCLAARKQESSLTCYNLGVRQHTSRHIMERWQDETQRRLIPEQSMRLVFSFGAADAVERPGRTPVPVDESRQNLRIILEAASRNYPVLMIGPPPVVDPERSQRIQSLTEVYETGVHQSECSFFKHFSRITEFRTLILTTLFPVTGYIRPLRAMRIFSDSFGPGKPGKPGSPKEIDPCQ